ncbi:hypothetical protein DV738_g5375, partial [Chaetothyriales sp. CBS 135597]
MSDPEIATKAPESDADEGGLGEHCTSDRPLLSSDTEAAGTIGKLGDIDTYITKPASYPSVPAPLLLLLTGGTGIHSPNNQRQADKYASAGFVVIMPDQFAKEDTPTAPSLLESIKLKAVEAAKSFLIDMWLARQTPEKVLPRLRKVLEAAREEYADCLARSGGAIYAAGYCFGAKADVKGIKAPVSIVAVENDPLFPDEILEIGRKHLAASAISHEVKVYPGVPHGFAVLGDYADPHIQEQQEKAFEQMLGWLKSH